MSVKFQRNGKEVTLKASVKEAERKINERIELGKKLLQKQIANEEQLEEAKREQDKWHTGNTYIIEQIFTGKDVLHIYSPPWGVVHSPPPGLSERVDKYVKQILEYIKGLEIIAELLYMLEEYENKEEEPDIESNPWSSKKVFIAYGHDKWAKDTVAWFIEKIELEPVILDEQTSGGSITIIEKLLRETTYIVFAVILFTPDDVGADKEKSSKLKQRARQNVILELGYFLRKLGRDKVVVLKKGDIEIPTDYSGVIYHPFDDNDGWQLKIAGELQKAGTPFNASKLIPS